MDYTEKLERWFALGKGKPTNAEVREAGRLLEKGDVVVNRWTEHGWAPATRELVVVADVRRMPFFILEDNNGKTVWMRTRTLVSRYRLHPSGPVRVARPWSVS